MDWLNRIQSIRNDPWEFLKIVKTNDPSDRENPIKPFPSNLEYLQLYVRIWQARNKIAVPKSRRMMLTWVNIALFTWDAAFHSGRQFGFVSKKEEHADDLVKKAKILLDSIEEKDLPRQFIPKYETTFNKLKFPEIDSIIQGFPSGADQLRQFTFTGLFFDEMGFLDEALEMYSASLPTIEGAGGKFVAVSSPAPGFFKSLVLDDLDSSPNKDKEIKPRKVLYPIEGVEIWENPKNGFTVFQIHYKANPLKRDPKYIQSIKEAMPSRQWAQEYELQWESFGGLAVFADWDVTIHGVKKDIQPQIGLPLLLGWDWGLTPACIVCQLQEDTLCCLREFTATNMGAKRFIAWIIPQLKTAYHLWQDMRRDYLCFIDPSGEFRSDSDEGSCAKELDSADFKNIIPGPVAWEERKNSVEHFLTRRTRNGPCLQVSMPNCPILTRGFQGGYRYNDRVMEIEPNKLRPLKDVHSHIQDALQMVTSRILITKPSQISEVPSMYYQWSHERESFSDKRGFET